MEQASNRVEIAGQDFQKHESVNRIHIFFQYMK